jgi:hypothetical protein
VNFKVEAGETLVFQVDNQYPGGEPRTIGYWKNWNTCTGGGQAETAAANGGTEEGWYLLDDVLNDPGITIGVLTLGGEDCLDAVALLGKSDIVTGKVMASDAAYNLAAQLLAANLNLSAGAETCAAVLDAVSDAQTLLVSIAFDGTGGYLRPNKKDLYDYGNALAFILDTYNNGALCDGGGVVVPPPPETPDLPPTVEITTSANGEGVISGDDLLITVTAIDDEGVDAITTVVYDNQGTEVFNFSGPSGTWPLTLLGSEVTDGNYTITATATDTIGQETSVSIVVTVDNEVDLPIIVADLTNNSPSWPNKAIWEVTVTLTLDQPVEGAVVSYSLSDGTDGTCVTVSGGCAITLSFSKKLESVTFTVEDIVAIGYYYNIPEPPDAVTITRPE